MLFRVFRKLMFFVFLTPLFGIAQTGGLYVSDFKLNNDSENWCWAISQDADNNMIFSVAQGVIVFDGINQTLINLPFSPTTIKFDSQTKNLWLAGFENAAVLLYKSNSTYELKMLAKQNDESFKSIVLLDNNVHFISNNLVHSFNQIDFADKGEIITEGRIEQAFIFKNKLSLIIDYFMHQLIDNKIVEVDYDLPVDEIAYTIPVNNERILLGSLENKFYELSSSSYQTKKISASIFFENNLLVNGLYINDSLYVISSIASGIAIVNYKNNRVYKQMSYFNGLADEEIRSMFVDNAGGIWISHQFGISRIDLHMNIENYSSYPGLKGTPVALKYFDKNLYVGTSDGLFVLSEIKDYDELTISVNVPVDLKIEVSKEINTIGPKAAVTEQEKSGKSMLKFLSRKKNKKEDKEIAVSEKPVVKKQKRTVKQSQTKKITKRSLKSISHQYKMVKGLNDKCRQLMVFENALFIAGNNALYALKNNQVERIIKNAYIISIYKHPVKSELFCCTNNGIYKVFKSGLGWEVDHFAESTDTYINDLVFEKNNQWVMAFDNMIARVELKNKDIDFKQSVELPESPGMVLYIEHENDSTFVFSGNKKYYFNNNEKLELVNEFNDEYKVINNQSGVYWLFNNNAWKVNDVKRFNIDEQSYRKLRLYQSIRYIEIEDNGDIWFIEGKDQVVKITSNDDVELVKPTLLITSLKANDESLSIKDQVLLPFNKTHLLCKLSAPFYLQQMGVNYSYQLVGIDDDWSVPSSVPKIDIKYIPPGEYTLKIKAINSFGFETDAQSIEIVVAKPFSQSVGFIFLVIALTLSVAFLLFKIRMRKLEKDKELLEKKVKERTQTIEEQKGRIEKQHDEITQSIRYAQRIQKAILPHDEIIEAMLPNHFILFKPRDIVSGDFYFFKPVGDKIIFVAADCTGHGVPGAFMSMLGISFLSEITSQLKHLNAAEIVNHLREKIKITLGQTSIDSAQKDGMDLGITIIDIAKKEIQFAGAYNPLYIINNTLETVKADRQPVAVHYVEKDFTNNVIKVKKGDVFYMFSDGYPDQIGGPSERKFMTKNFKTLLTDIHRLPMEKQRKTLDEKIMEWKGNKMQIDDILVIGFCLD